MSQNITQHKAQDTSSPRRNGGHFVEVTTKQTLRKIGRILMVVQEQFVEFLKGRWSVNDLQMAFKDKNVKAAMQKGMREGTIGLITKDSREPVFRRELTLIGQHGEDAENHDEDDVVDVDPENA